MPHKSFCVAAFSLCRDVSLLCCGVCGGGEGGGCPHRWRSLPFDRLVNRLNTCAKSQSSISATGPLEGSLRLQTRKRISVRFD